MRLKRLLLERYGLFKDKVELSFSDSGIDVIVGDNESGKSTLMDGILSIIFGTKREERENLIPWNESASGEGTLEIETDKSIKIKRVIESQHTTVTFNHDSNPEEVFSDKASPQGKKEAAHYFDMLNEIFRFSDRNILESLTFIKQNEAETQLGEKIREIITGSGKGDYKKAIDDLMQEADDLTAEVYWAKKKRQDKVLENLEIELTELKNSLEEALTVRDEGGDIEGELKTAKINLGKLEKKLKSEEDKLENFKKFIKSVEKMDRAEKEQKKLLGEIKETEKLKKGQEELEEKLNDELVVRVKDGGETLRDEFNEIRTIKKKIAKIENEIDGIKDEKVEEAAFPSNRVKAVIVIVVVAVGVAVGQFWNSTQMSALLAFVFGSIAAALLMLLGRKKPASTDTLQSVRESDLKELIEREKELREKYSIILSVKGISQTLQLIDDIKEWETELRLNRDTLSQKKPFEELEAESKTLLQTVLLADTVLENLEDNFPDLLKTERKRGEAEAIEAEQKIINKKSESEIESLETLIIEYEKKIAIHEVKGVGNIDLLHQEIETLEEEVNSKRLESDALQLAVKTLEESVEKFQESHHLRLSERISEWFGRFTAGKYHSVTLDDDWSPEIRTKEGKQIKPERLSVGAKDQLYFAMRLSLAELMSEDVNLPVVLDDPFVNYDERRLKISKELLEEISAEHQVLLFTHSADYSEWGKVVLNLNDYWRNN